MKPFAFFILVFVLVCFDSNHAIAQDNFRTAIGARIGGTSGISVKHFYQPNIAFEGIAGFFSNGFSLTGLIEKHQRAFDRKELSFYYGAGAHVAVYNNRYRYYSNAWRDVNIDRQTDAALGINGIVGLEYSVREIPLSFSLDIKPFIEVGSGGFVGFSPDPSFGIKFRF